MSLETDFIAWLSWECPRVYPDQAPQGVALPYVVWAYAGGPSWRYVDNSAPDKRRREIQVTVWAGTTKAASDLLTAIEVRCQAAAPALFIEPLGECVPAHDDANVLRGLHQDFAVTGLR